MIKLYYSNVEDLDLEKGYIKVSSQRKEKIDFYKFAKDKKLSCGAALLLLKVLSNLGVEDPIFKKGEFNKPYISNYPDIHFNLSHSKNLVACAVSDAPVGVDIEYIDFNIDLDIAKHYFYNNEYDSILNSSKPQEEFFNYWVLKESYMKYTGLGFNLALDSFNIDLLSSRDIALKIDDKLIRNVKFSLFSLDSYKLAAASRYEVESVTELDINDLY